MPVSPPVYCNKVDELVTFENQLAAENWLKENELDTSGTSILIPFKDEYKKIHFLRPGNFNSFSDQKNRKTKLDEANEAIRIIGAGNSSHISFIEKIKAALDKDRVTPC